MRNLIREAIEALEVLAVTASDAQHYRQAEEAADLAFRLRCALALETSKE